MRICSTGRAARKNVGLREFGASRHQISAGRAARKDVGLCEFDLIQIKF